MKKPVLGLSLQYFKVVFIASVLAAVGLCFPFVKMENESMRSIQILLELGKTNQLGGLSIILLIGIAATAAACLIAVIGLKKISIPLTRVWIACGVIEAFCYTVLLFGSKSMLDGANLLSEAFLVKNFGVGYWLCLIFAYVSLFFSMKLAKVNPGYIVLTLLGVVWLFPILWIILTSFRAESGYYVGYFMPKGFTLDNYKKLFEAESVIPFGKWWLNTFIVAICCAVCNTLIILATAYVFSRTRFKGRTALMKFLLVIGMFPGFMSMIAVYNILKGMGLAQTLFALIIVSVAGSAMGYHICKGFFDTIPKSLDEAAIIDGATRWQIFTRITIPLSKPIVIYTILTSFLGPWSDYIFPSILLGDKQSSYTVAVGLYWMTDFTRIEKYYTQFAAGAIVVAVPIVILFIWLQKYYVEGLSGAVKG